MHIGKAAEEVSIDIREAVESRPGFTFLAAGNIQVDVYMQLNIVS